VLTRYHPALFACVLALACTPEKVSPEELKTVLTAAGVHVQVGEVVGAELSGWPGAELSTDLVLDYEDSYRAVRFRSSDLGRNYCRTVTLGVYSGGWCLVPPQSPRMDTWNKVHGLDAR